MFATLNLERDPLRLADMPSGLVSWIQDAGGFSLLILLAVMAWARARWPGGLSAWLWGERGSQSWAPRLFRWSLIGSALGYAAAGLLALPGLLESAPAEAESGVVASSTATKDIVPMLTRYSGWALTFGAGCALFAACLPFFLNLARLRWRRIWGIARLSVKEVVRGKVLYVFFAFLLVLLFVGWFVKSKPENQLQSYVTIGYLCMTVLLLFSAALLAAFGIPTDIKQQTIHTIVTKPVERFELVLGRFLGYTLVMSLALLVMTTLCLGYVLRGINPEAAAESLKARVPVYGTLDFQRINLAEVYTSAEHADTVQRNDRTLNVGREWDYHRYIGGVDVRGKDPAIYAVWSFDDLPSVLARRNRVRAEYKFDIYRQSKGKEGEAVRCSFFLHTRYFNPAGNDRKVYADARQKLRALVRTTDAKTRQAQERDVLRALGEGLSEDKLGQLSAGEMSYEEIDDLLAERFGYYEILAAKVLDYHTLPVELPGGLFRNALSGPPGGNAGPRPGAPLLTTRVRCESPSQFLGMARYDFYFREDNPGENDIDRLAFAVNFYKGTLGVWMVLCLVTGLCVFISTELSGIITFLCVLFLYNAGWARGFIQDVAEGKNPGGGPVELAHRLFSRKVVAAQLEETTFKRIATGSDEVFRWFVRRFLNILPDVDRFSFTDRVANGFNVAVIGQDLLPTLLLLLGYLLPWALLAFYLIKSREIAGAT